MPRDGAPGGECLSEPHHAGGFLAQTAQRQGEVAQGLVRRCCARHRVVCQQLTTSLHILGDDSLHLNPVTDKVDVGLARGAAHAVDVR